MRDITVVAMGGNSLIDPSQPPTVENQFRLTEAAMGPVADLVARGERLLLTHGNGPQVGFMLLRVELAKNVLHEVALDSLVADTQGSLGYMIQRSLRQELGRRGLADAHPVVSLVTEILVDPDDHAFIEPTKPIGQFYTAEEAETLRERHGWSMMEDAHRGYRRVVPSPSPVAIVQLATIEAMSDAGNIVIACGGGGIPIVQEANGEIRGVEGVIDKDRASALLATQLKARRLLITTGIDHVYVDFHGPNQRALTQTTVSELRRLDAERQFADGSMRPKVEAAVRFLDHGGEEVIICRPEDLLEAIEGQAGTRIVPG